MKSKRTVFRVIPARVRPVTAAVAAAIGGITSVGPAMAAPTPELVVSATRRDTSTQDVPYSISVLSADDIEQRRIDDLSDVARWTPGLYQPDQGARDGSRLIIRGINSSGIDDPIALRNSTGDRVATYYGETPVFVDLEPIDIERIEVLKGPQGTLYGAPSLAGAIRYIPAKPDTTEQTFDLRIGAYDQNESNDRGKQIEAVINAPIIENTLALRALLGYSHEAGYIDYNFLVPVPGVSCPEPGYSDPECSSDGFNRREDANDVDTRSAGLALLWSPSDDVEAVLSFRRQNQSIGGRSVNSTEALELIEQNRGIDLQTGNYIAGLRFTEPNSRVTDIANLNVIYDFGTAKLNWSTSYTSYEQRGRRDQTDLLLDLDYYYEEFPAFTGFTDDRTEDDVFTQEVRLVSDPASGPWNWIAGVFYQQGDFFNRSQEFTPGYAAWDPFFTTDQGDLEYDSKSIQEDTQTAFFGEIGYAFSDRFSVLAGARWFEYDFEARSCTAFPILTTGVGGSPDVDDPSNCAPPTGFETSSEDDILFKFNATYAFTEELNGYFAYSEGYSTGGVNLNFDTADERIVESEKTRNYEVGMKSGWLDGALRFDAALFFIEWEDIQVEGRTSSGQLLTRNGGEAESKGLELQLAANVTERLSTGLSYAYTQAELSEGCNAAALAAPGAACVLPDEVSASGDRLPGSPEHQGAAWVDYAWPLGNGMELDFHYDLVAQGDVFTRLGNGDDCCRDNGEELPGFAIHNASVSLSKDNWQATLYADNLTDKYAVTAVRTDRTKLTTAGGGPDFTLRRYFNDVIRPRVIGLDLRFRFK